MNSRVVTTGTLSLAVRLPLLGRARDLHPLDYAHVGRTKKRLRNHVWFPQAFFIVSIYISFYQAFPQAFFSVVLPSP